MNILYKINSTLKRFLPESAYSKTRLQLIKLYRNRLKTFSEAEIRELFYNLGIKKGSVVFVHSSMNQIKTEFPFYQLTDILLDIIGKEGTILFPCWQEIKDFDQYVRNGIVFDVKRTPTCLGILPELARRRKGSVRSLSPYNSVVAIGNNADYFVREHHLDELSLGKKSPLFKLAQENGIILGIGVTTRYLSFVHCVEDTYEGIFPMQVRHIESTPMKVKTLDNEIITVNVKLPHPNISVRNIPSYLKKHIAPEIARDFKINRTNFFVAQAKPLLTEMSKLAQKNITIYRK